MALLKLSISSLIHCSEYICSRPSWMKPHSPFLKLLLINTIYSPSKCAHKRAIRARNCSSQQLKQILDLWSIKFTPESYSQLEDIQNLLNKDRSTNQPIHPFHNVYIVVILRNCTLLFAYWGLQAHQIHRIFGKNGQNGGTSKKFGRKIVFPKIRIYQNFVNILSIFKPSYIHVD